MQCVNDIDVIEQDIADYSYPLLDILLMDRTTGKNIIWATDDYSYLGEFYEARKQIIPALIIGNNTRLIQPRTAKAQSAQMSRTRKKAEVFTPAWICNAQNSMLDDAWFGKDNVFNTPGEKSWVTKKEPIEFPDDKHRTWRKYIDSNRLEITCGEAPYLTSRYDAATGRVIALKDRIGFLDRKLRVVNENVSDENEWLKWTKRAFQSIYGYEFQGDSLLLARENLLYTFIDNIRFALNREPTLRELKSIATIVSWNLWQMDGLTGAIPYGETREDQRQVAFLDIFDVSDLAMPQGKEVSKYCRIKDWRSKVVIEYRSLLKGKK